MELHRGGFTRVNHWFVTSRGRKYNLCKIKIISGLRCFHIEENISRNMFEGSHHLVARLKPEIPQCEGNQHTSYVTATSTNHVTRIYL